MQSIALLALNKIYKNNKRQKHKDDKKNFFLKSQGHDSGFTLIELIVVVAMVGIIAAIGAPSWIGFLAQQRVNKTNDVVFTALLDAQKEAKKNKNTYNVAFRYNQTKKASEILVYHGAPEPITSTNIQNSRNWKVIGEDIGVKQGEVFIYTNLDGNTYNKQSTPNIVTTTPGTGTISFDFMGTVTQAELGGSSSTTNTVNNSSLGLKIAVAAASPGAIAAGRHKRCVIIETIIGGMRSAKDADCN
jgi:prepilin-type N-terminal cleavage/methylation domain-containing protein